MTVCLKIIAVFIVSYDFNTSEVQILGYHTAPIKCVEYCPDVGKLIFVTNIL